MDSTKVQVPIVTVKDEVISINVHPELVPLMEIIISKTSLLKRSDAQVIADILETQVLQYIQALEEHKYEIDRHLSEHFDEYISPVSWANTIIAIDNCMEDDNNAYKSSLKRMSLWGKIKFLFS